MVSNEYSEEDFRIYIQEEAKELQEWLEKVSAAVAAIAEYPDRECAEAGVRDAYFPAEELFRNIKRLTGEMVHEKLRITHGEAHPPLAQKVARSRRRRERNSN